MKNSILGLAIVTAALTLTAAHAAQDVLRLRQPFVLNGVEVQPGDYRVTVSPSLDSVQLTVGTKVVASSPCKVSPVATPVRRDEVFSRPNAGGRDEIVRLVLSNPARSIEMLPSVSAEAAMPGATGGNR